MNTIAIGITGHRMLSTAEEHNVWPVLLEAFRHIMASSLPGADPSGFVAISPLAEGADTLFAKAAVASGIPLNVLLPFERDPYLQTFSSDEVRSRFFELYNTVSPGDIKVLGSVTNTETNELFLRLGIYLVDHVDYLIAIWNQKKALGKGGTAEIVDYAVQQNKKILLINPELEQPQLDLQYDL